MNDLFADGDDEPLPYLPLMPMKDTAKEFELTFDAIIESIAFEKSDPIYNTLVSLCRNDYLQEKATGASEKRALLVTMDKLSKNLLSLSIGKK